MPSILRSINPKSGVSFDDVSNLPVDAALTSNETRAGIIQIATQTEVNAGTDDVKSITSLKLKTVINTDGFIQNSSISQKGVIQIASNSQTDSGTDNQTAISPYQLQRQKTNLPAATTTVIGIIQLATNSETNTGTDANKAVTPATLANRLSSFTIPGAAPTGSVVDFAGSTAPTGYLVCDGASYSTTTYANLFAVIGFIFGGSGSSFNVPDCRGRTSIGSGTGTSLTARTLGQNFGEENHLLTTAEIPSHGHSANTVIYTGLTSDSLFNAAVSAYVSANANQYGKNFNNVVSISNTGGGAPHNVVQPSIVFNKIIKT